MVYKTHTHTHILQQEILREKLLDKTSNVTRTVFVHLLQIYKILTFMGEKLGLIYQQI